MDKQKRLLLKDININISLGNLVINVLNVNYEPPVPMRFFNNHSHSSYELHFISEGKGTLRIGKTNYEISPGTFYLTGPGIYHEQISDSEEPMVEYCINLELKHLDKWGQRDNSLPAQEVLELSKVLINTTFWVGSDTYSSWLLIKKIIEEYENPMLGYCRNIECLVVQLVINTVRCFSGHKKVYYSKSTNNSSEKRRLTMDSFFREYNTPLKAKMLSSEMGIGMRQLERLMLQYYGMTFKDKLIKTRVDVAKDLLQNTILSSEEIAFKTGFSSSSHFSRIFSQHEGLSPSVYRKNQN